jgi:hypothetical protein
MRLGMQSLFYYPFCHILLCSAYERKKYLQNSRFSDLKHKLRKGKKKSKLKASE